jgi:ribose transport system ATP-binding protein
MRRRGDESKRFDTIANRLALHPRRGDIPGRSYSGGNQQKLVVGRWLSTRCEVLLLDEPTQGVDVGARRDLYDAIREVTADGRAAVVTSSEPEELRQLADRVLVLSRGHIVAELPAAEVTERRLLDLSHSEEP